MSPMAGEWKNPFELSSHSLTLNSTIGYWRIEPAIEDQSPTCDEMVQLHGISIGVDHGSKSDLDFDSQLASNWSNLI